MNLIVNLADNVLLSPGASRDMENPARRNRPPAKNEYGKARKAYFHPALSDPPCNDPSPPAVFALVRCPALGLVGAIQANTI